MKIFFIDPNNTTPRLNYPLVKSLQREGVDITFFTAWHQQKTAYYDKVYTAQPQYRFFCRSNKIKLPALRRFIKLFSYPATLNTIIKQANKEKPQLVHINWLIFPKVELGFIRKLQKMEMKVILTQHNYFQHDTNQLKSGEMAVFKAVDRIICLSKFVASQFPPELQNKIIQIEHGNCFALELSNFKSELVRSSSVITAVFVGGISHYKGLDLLIEAVSILKSKHQLPNLKIKIIGQGSDTYAAYLNHLITKFGLQNYFEFKNSFVSYEELLMQIAKAGFGIMTYRSATQSGLPYLFASLFKPLIVTEVGGLPEQVDEAFTQFVRPESVSIAQGLLKLIQKCKIISNDDFATFNAKTKWQNTVKKYIINYREII